MLDSGLPQHFTRARRLALLGAVLTIVVGLLGLATTRVWLTDPSERTRAPLDFAAGVTLPDVALVDGSGRQFGLTTLVGVPYLLFFGYTSCPDFCPLTLGTFSAVKTQLGNLAAEARFVFVSVDGERDTPAVVAEYVARFEPDFIGVTGRADDVRTLGAPLGLWFETQAGEGALGYAVDHTTDIYLIGPDGAPTRSYPFDTSSTVLADDLRALID